MESKKQKKTLAAMLGQAFGTLTVLWVMAIFCVLMAKLLVWLWML